MRYYFYVAVFIEHYGSHCLPLSLSFCELYDSYVVEKFFSFVVLRCCFHFVRNLLLSGK